MTEIYDYLVVAIKGEQALAANIMTKIQLGWQPFGGVSTTFISSNDSASGGIWFSQAMVKVKPVLG